MALPRVSTNTLMGLIEALAGPPYNGKADLPDIAATLQMEVDDLFPVVETLQLLRFVDIGRRRYPPDRRKAATSLIRMLMAASDSLPTTSWPTCPSLLSSSACSTSGRAIARPFALQRSIADFMSEEAAEQTLSTAITWGRYAELFAYDEETRQFSLENPS